MRANMLEDTYAFLEIWTQLQGAGFEKNFLRLVRNSKRQNQKDT
jgi:hypothetical protein